MASIAVARFRRSVRGLLTSSVLQCKSCRDQGLQRRVSPRSETLSSGNHLLEAPFPRKFPLAVPKIDKFEVERRVYDRYASLARSHNECSVYQTVIAVLGRVGQPRIIIWKPQLTRTRFYTKERNYRRASTNVAHESNRDSPKKRLVCGKHLPIGLAYGRRSRRTPRASTANEEVTILENRQQKGIIIDSYTFVQVLRLCSKQKDLTATRQVHGLIIRTGMNKHPYVATTLLNVYIKCGRLQDARKVFDGLEKSNRNVITWTVMIGEYAKSGCGVEAYRLFLQMKWEGFLPDAITYMSILNTSASAGALEWVKDVHGHARRAGLESDLRVGSALVRMYAKSGSVGDARVVFDTLKTRDVTTWTIMIGAYAESGCGAEAYRLFLRMEREGFKPNAYTYASILNASVGALDWVKEVHRHALEAGLESDLRVGGALVHMYAKSGYIDDARLVFNRMKDRDVITWNIMIGGLAHHGFGHEAVDLFRKMKADCVKPNGTSFVAVLSACCHAGLVDDGRRLFLDMTQDDDIEPTVVHYNCMVDLLGRVGHLEEAKLMIDNMPVEPDAVTWKALLGACRTHGNRELGELAAEEIFKIEPKDAAAYVLLSNIYAAAGNWEKVASVRTMMHNRGVRKEPGRSWIEVDNKIHEFVVGDTSHPEAKAIYSELDRLNEQLKAKGYIPDTKLVLHNIDEKGKELALRSHSEKLAIVYGLLRVPRGKSIRVKKNLRVCSDCHAATKLMSEVTGREIIVRDANRFHHFKDGVCSCGDYW